MASVDAALRVLLLVKDRGEVRVTEIARELDIGRATAHRLLTTLVRRDFLTQDRLGKAYRWGPVLVELSAAAIEAVELRSRIRPHLTALAHRTGETANLIILEGAGVRFIDSVPGTHPTPRSARTGSVLPATTSAGGKVLLAWLSDQELRTLYPEGPPGLTPRSITGWDPLAVELAQVRQRGYATNHEGSLEGLAAISVPIRAGQQAPIGAIALSMRAEKLDARAEQRLIPVLFESARLIEAEFATATAPN